MRIVDLLKKQGIQLNVSVDSKEAAIDTLVGLMDATGNITSKEEYKKGILAREEMGTTAIGEGIAIPHSKNSAVKQAGLAAMTVPAGVDFDSMDEQPSNLFFMIAAPAEGSDVHLEVLSRLSTILMDSAFRANLLAAKDKDEFLGIIDAKEKAKFPEDSKVEEKPAVKSGYRILAVTACPTGIAHTFMAAESLENKGKEMGYLLKAETNGSGGAKNVLTKAEIEAADGIIVAADKNIEMARFDGKKVLKVKVADGIHKPEELINKIIEGRAPVYHHNTTGKLGEEDTGETESAGRTIYKHLMNGVSHMLPFVIGGGILIAIAFILDDYAIDPKNFGMNTPMAAFFKTLGGTAFDFMLPILAGFIAMSIGDRPGLVVGIVGGALAKTGMTFAQPAGAISPGFLGALFAGFAAGYLVVGLRKLTNKFPASLEGIKAMLIYPIAGILLIGIIMAIFNPLIAVLNTGLNTFLGSMGGTSKILLGAILGGMMSIDMGGPFNKAAYVFGTASIESGNFDIMAAVMVGGMVPPLAIALSTMIFKNRYTKKERQSGIVNIIMGFSFITEGAIPFAASDPLRVIPSCIAGSAVAGALSMAFGCGLRAPHGGIWVIAVISNPVGFIAALIIGSFVAMGLLGLLKKPLAQNS